MRRQLERAGQDTSNLPEIPVLSSALVMYSDAFYELCTTRVNGMGISPISVLSVDQYAYNRQYGDFQIYFLRKVVNLLDPIFMEHKSRELKAGKKGKHSK